MSISTWKKNRPLALARDDTSGGRLLGDQLGHTAAPEGLLIERFLIDPHAEVLKGRQQFLRTEHVERVARAARETQLVGCVGLEYNEAAGPKRGLDLRKKLPLQVEKAKD